MARPVTDISERELSKRQQQHQQKQQQQGRAKKRIKYVSTTKCPSNTGDGSGHDDDRYSDEKFLFTLMLLYCLFMLLIIYFGLNYSLAIMVALCLVAILIMQ